MASSGADDPRTTLLTELLAAAPRLLRYCRRRLGCEQDAEDACQETYVEVFRKLDDVLLNHAYPMGWLFKTANNKCRDVYRRRQRTTLMAEVPETAGDDILDELVAREDVRGLLERLSSPLREVAQLRYEGFSSRLIGERLGINENAVNLRMHRVRQILRPWLERPAG